MKRIRYKISTQLYILISFTAVIAFGTICFLLPWSTKNGEGLDFLDALFTSTSATCVTGLSTIDCSKLSCFGQVILAILIELGGLSFLTIATFIYSMFSKMSIRSFKLMNDAINNDHPGEVLKMIRKIISIALIIQFIGFIFNYLIFNIKYDMGVSKSLGYGAFHAISAFNNAGFDLFGTNSLIDFSSDWLLNINTMLLIILGGIGFMTIDEVVRKRRWKRFSLTTKIVLTTTLILLISGTLLLKLSLLDKISFLEALFTSTTARTAGFTTIDMQSLNTPSYIVMLVLMFIGASPTSTGGGLKTTTLFIIILAIYRFIHNQKTTTFKRKVPSKIVIKAFTIFAVEIIYIMLVTFFLSFFEKGLTFDKILFEVVSAFATVGLSMGVTPNLSIVGQIVIIITMFIGRLGPLTILSISTNQRKMIKDYSIDYIEEKVIIG